MSNSKSCIPYFCTSSGHKWVCKRHNIGTQCGATATNIAAQTTENIYATNNQQNQQNFQKLLRQLEVVSSPAVEGQNNPDGYQPAAFVPSKVPRWRTPPFLNILIPEHHITPHMIKVNVMAKLNTVPDSALNEIEKFLDIWTFKWKCKIKRIRFLSCSKTGPRNIAKCQSLMVFMVFTVFLEYLDSYFDKLWFLNKPNKRPNHEYCLDVARLQKTQVTKPWLNGLDN